MAQRERGASSRTSARSRRLPPAAQSGESARAGRPGRATDVRDDRPPAVDLRALRDKVRRLVEPAIIDAGLDLDDIVLTRAGRRIVVRVTVDGDAGVGHDELSEVSHDISAVLDEAEQRHGELTPGSYTLEVSSPGVDRPLTLPRHWRRNTDRLVKVTTTDGDTLTGRIVGSDDSAATLDVDGDPREVAYAEVAKALVQVEFNRKPSHQES